MTDSDPHYDRLAGDFDRLWTHSDEFVTGMTDAIVDHLGPAPSDAVVDLGGGTGLYAKALVARLGLQRPLLVVDPSAPMMEELSDASGIEVLVADAEELADSKMVVDRILIKEAVHHFANPSSTLGRLSALLAPGGRILVVMLPPKIEYPLFSAALRRFEEVQPHYMEIANAFALAGLEIGIAHHTFTVEMPTARYIEMVRERYMSLLSGFSDEELADGIAEMERSIATPTVVIPDHFVFVTGLLTDD